MILAKMDLPFILDQHASYRYNPNIKGVPWELELWSILYSARNHKFIPVLYS